MSRSARRRILRRQTRVLKSSSRKYNRWVRKSFPTSKF